MKISTREWIESAESEMACALRAYRARQHPSYDHVCFHAHLCVEKYLKAKLNEAWVKFTKTHELTELLAQVAAVEPSVADLQPQAEFLDAHAKLHQYPDRRATKAQAQQAIKDCRTARSVMRTMFGLSD
ncbi:MAG: HEPN domain-containing protein [Acidobacteria bacterium]|nr:HEPN domain-containing protein [Acidobacteriota bacterium]